MKLLKLKQFMKNRFKKMHLTLSDFIFLIYFVLQQSNANAAFSKDLY